MQHRDERGEDFGFGPLHHVLVGLQDALQDEGEGRQDVGGRRHHAGRAKRETFVREGGRVGRLNELSRQGVSSDLLHCLSSTSSRVAIMEPRRRQGTDVGVVS